KLVESYLVQAISALEAVRSQLQAFEVALGTLTELIAPFANLKRKDDPLTEPWNELKNVKLTLMTEIEAFDAEASAREEAWRSTPRDNAGLHAARLSLHPLAERCRDLSKRIDLAAKLTGRVIDIAVDALDARKSGLWGNGEVN